jgi:hypothetical protein
MYPLHHTQGNVCISVSPKGAQFFTFLCWFRNLLKMVSCAGVVRIERLTDKLYLLASSLYQVILVHQKTNSVASSPQANYTDWATATCWRNLVSTFVDRVVSRGQRGATPTAVNLSFLDRSRYFFFQVAPHLSWRAWVDPVPDPLLLRKCSAGNRTSRLTARNSDH